MSSSAHTNPYTTDLLNNVEKDCCKNKLTCQRRRFDSDLIGGEEEPGVLGREGVEGDGGLVAHIELEVQQRLGEQDHVAHLQGGRVQDVVVADEARVDGALEHQERLGCAGVGVQGHHPTDGEVQPGVRDALRVEPGVKLRTGQRHDGPCGCLGDVVHIAAWNHSGSCSVSNPSEIEHIHPRTQ